MKKIILLGICILSAQSVLADIPPPPHSRPDPGSLPMETKIVGSDATDLANSLAGEGVRLYPGSSLRFTTSSFKVFRSNRQTTQIACEVWTSQFGRRPQSECTITQSTNGRPLPEFRPLIRMG